jgi:hypothetical protein
MTRLELTSKMIAEYVEHAVQFEHMAAEAADPKLREALLEQASAYRKLADVAITENEIRLRFHRRAHPPIVLASALIDQPVAVPWWHGRVLRLIAEFSLQPGSRVRAILRRGNPG